MIGNGLSAASVLATSSSVWGPFGGPSAKIFRAASLHPSRISAAKAPPAPAPMALREGQSSSMTYGHQHTTACHVSLLQGSPCLVVCPKPCKIWPMIFSWMVHSAHYGRKPRSAVIQHLAEHVGVWRRSLHEGWPITWQKSNDPMRTRLAMGAKATCCCLENPCVQWVIPPCFIIDSTGRLFIFNFHVFWL